MKGLILKDLYNMGRNLKSLCFILLIFLVAFIPTNGITGYVFATAVMSGTWIITTFSFDEMSKWNRYALVMPLNKKQIVISKYITFIIFVLAGIVASSLLGALGVAVLNSETINNTFFAETAVATLLAFSFVSVVGGIIIPLVFKFGTERARLLIMVSSLVPAGVVYGVYKLLEYLDVDLASINIYCALSVVFVLAVLFLALSMKISCKIFYKQDI